MSASSKMLYDYFHFMSLSDLESMLEGKELAKAFIRGFYESEGSYRIDSWEKVRSGKTLEMSNENLELLTLIQRCLKKLGLEFHFYRRVVKQGFNPGVLIYLLRTRRREQINRFLSLIQPCIKNDLSQQRNVPNDIYDWINFWGNGTQITMGFRREQTLSI